MSTGGPASGAPSVSGASALTSPRRGVWWLLRETVATCLRYRVTGLAAEAGFFALLSLPPLILGLFATLGYFPALLGAETVLEVRTDILALARRALTDEIVSNTIAPTLDDALFQQRTQLVSLGFLLSLWSGSRAVNVIVDTVSIMYGLGGKRGIIRQRALSFGLYVVALVLGAVFVPLLLAGPDLISAVLPNRFDGLVDLLYWPAVVLLAVPSLALLYHVSIPVRTKWRRALPGAALALALWVLFSFLLRRVIAASIGSTSIYGPLATPIVVLIWLYAVAIAVLIGAALNSAIDRIWVERATFLARREQRLADAREAAEQARQAAAEEEQAAREAGLAPPRRVNPGRANAGTPSTETAGQQPAQDLLTPSRPRS